MAELDNPSQEEMGLPKEATEFNDAKSRANLESATKKDFSQEPAQKAFENLKQSDKSPESQFSESLEVDSRRTIKELLSDREKISQNVELRDNAVEDKDVLELLSGYQIEASSLKLDENGFYHLKVNTEFDRSKLPESYAYKGGAARSLLLQNLGVDKNYPPRDLDVVRLAKEEPYPNADEKVAQTLMGEDYQHGNGVEVIDDNKVYFATRDLTINEVLATNEEIILTKECLLDTVRHIFRLSDYEKDFFGGPGPKMLSKMIRFYAEAVHRGQEVSIEGVEDWELEENFIPPFWLALQMDRAFQQGSEVAEEYTRQLIRYNQIPQEAINAKAAASYLIDLLQEDHFYYRYAPTEQFKQEEKWAEEYSDYDLLPKFRGHGRSRGNL